MTKKPPRSGSTGVDAAPAAKPKSAKPKRTPPAPGNSLPLPGVSAQAKSNLSLPGVKAPGKGEKFAPTPLKPAPRLPGKAFDPKSEDWKKGGHGHGQVSGGPPPTRPFKGGGRGR